jgi:hypothetical protein
MLLLCLYLFVVSNRFKGDERKALIKMLRDLCVNNYPLRLFCFSFVFITCLSKRRFVSIFLESIFCVFIYLFVYVVFPSLLKNKIDLQVCFLFLFWAWFVFPGNKQRGKEMRILKGNLSTNECETRVDDAGAEKKSINPELWQACAGPLVNLPAAGTHVVYFPQGHSEQVRVCCYFVPKMCPTSPHPSFIGIYRLIICGKWCVRILIWCVLSLIILPKLVGWV